MRGSAFHGNKFNKKTQVHDGPYFDSDGKSDLDFFLVSKDLTDEAMKRRFIKSADARVGLGPGEIQDLGIELIADELRRIGRTTGRTVTIRRFPTDGALQAEGSYMRIAVPTSLPDGALVTGHET